MKSYDEKETRKIAYDLAKNAKPKDIFCLCGDLGVGKTVFVKGFADALQINEDITSPTFSIVNVYESGVLPLYHFDVYRILNEYDMDYTGYEEYFYGDGICLIEWAENIKNIIPKNAVWIDIKKDLLVNENFREIHIKTGEVN